MYRGKENETFHHFSTSPSKLYESENETLQKEVETYTRKFEEEKRRLFRIQEGHRSVFKKYNSHLHELKTLKGKPCLEEVRNLKAKIKILEVELEKGISSYNSSLSKNNSLKNEIDESRKHRKIQIEAYRKLQTKVDQYTKIIDRIEGRIYSRKEEFQKLKFSIMKIKNFNEE